MKKYKIFDFKYEKNTKLDYQREFNLKTIALFFSAA
jgi:hypothetical protein